MPGRCPALSSTAALGLGGAGGEAILTDGQIIANNANTYTVGNNAVITYALGDAKYGYDVTAVNTYSGWNDSGRENITVASLAYSTLDDPTTFVTIPETPVDYEGGNSIAVVR